VQASPTDAAPASAAVALTHEELVALVDSFQERYIADMRKIYRKAAPDYGRSADPDVFAEEKLRQPSLGNFERILRGEEPLLGTRLADREPFKKLADVLNWAIRLGVKKYAHGDINSWGPDIKPGLEEIARSFWKIANEAADGDEAFDRLARLVLETAEDFTSCIDAARQGMYRLKSGIRLLGVSPNSPLRERLEAVFPILCDRALTSVSAALLNESGVQDPEAIMIRSHVSILLHSIFGPDCGIVPQPGFYQELGVKVMHEIGQSQQLPEQHLSPSIASKVAQCSQQEIRNRQGRSYDGNERRAAHRAVELYLQFTSPDALLNRLGEDDACIDLLTPHFRTVPIRPHLLLMLPRLNVLDKLADGEAITPEVEAQGRERLARLEAAIQKLPENASMDDIMLGGVEVDDILLSHGLRADNVRTLRHSMVMQDPKIRAELQNLLQWREAS
jgi:hypothetical protein